MLKSRNGPAEAKQHHFLPSLRTIPMGGPTSSSPIPPQKSWQCSSTKYLKRSLSPGVLVVCCMCNVTFLHNGSKWVQSRQLSIIVVQTARCSAVFITCPASSGHTQTLIRIDGRIQGLEVWSTITGGSSSGDELQFHKLENISCVMLSVEVSRCEVTRPDIRLAAFLQQHKELYKASELI